MEFKTHKNSFFQMVDNIQGIVERSPIKVSLLNLYFKTEEGYIEGIASDGKLHCRDKCPAEVFRPGKIAVPAKRIYDIIKLLPDGEVSFKVGENRWIDIQCFNSLYHLPGYDDDDFEQIPSFPLTSDQVIKIPVENFTNMIGKTSFALSEEMERAISNLRIEILADELRMVGTDGHRLALAKRPFSGPAEPVYLLLSKKSAKELKRIFSDKEGELDFTMDDRNYYFKLNDTQFIAQKQEGLYPDYRKVIPTSAQKRLIVNREVLIQAIQRVSVMSEQGSLGIFFDVMPNSLKAYAETPEMGTAKDEFNIEYNGEEFSISYNPFYLVEILRLIEEERVIFEINDIYGPCVIKGENADDYICLLMPMKPR